MKRYDYSIDAKEIIPSMLNGISWAGKVEFIFETSTGKDIPLDADMFAVSSEARLEPGFIAHASIFYWQYLNIV